MKVGDDLFAAAILREQDVSEATTNQRLQPEVKESELHYR